MQVFLGKELALPPTALSEGDPIACLMAFEHVRSPGGDRSEKFCIAISSR
jgi:hypothetical protein